MLIRKKQNPHPGLEVHYSRDTLTCKPVVLSSIDAEAEGHFHHQTASLPPAISCHKSPNDPLHRLWVALGQQELPRDVLEHSQLLVLPVWVYLAREMSPGESAGRLGSRPALQSLGAAPTVEVHLKAELYLMGNQPSPEPTHQSELQSWVISLPCALCRILFPSPDTEG